MSYQVLARKWRPNNFEQLVGQEHVLQALVNALDQDRLHHAYLFTGTRGVGKTTIARILAKCLNCEEGVRSVPCDACASCIEIREGRCVDLIEVDAASRTKVEDTRELLENVQYAPTRCRYKIYLIDEVHMLSNHSFNALLKTLEEPPPHVKFLLATTDPQKLPVTILSRCLQFNLKNLTPDRIVEHLQHVLTEEQVPYEESALWQLARAADGSMRDALSLTDQGIAFGENQLRETEIANMLGTIDRDKVYQVVQGLIDQDPKAVLEVVAEIAEHAPDFASILEQLISVLHRVSVVQAVPDALDNYLDHQDRIAAFASAMSPQDVQLFYQVALIGRRDLPLNPEPRAGLEMVLLRMLAFKPEGIAPDPDKKKPLKTRQEGPSRATGATAEAKSAPALVSSSSGALARQAISPGEVSGERAKLGLVVDNSSNVAEQVHHSDESLAAEQPEPRSTPEQEDGDANAHSPQRVEGLVTNTQWIALARQLAVKGMTRNVLMECVLEAVAGKQIMLFMHPQFIDLMTPTHEDRINRALLEFFGEAITMRVTAKDHQLETPGNWLKRIRKEKVAKARQALENDDVIQALQKKFGARIIEESIEPTE